MSVYELKKEVHHIEGLIHKLKKEVHHIEGLIWEIKKGIEEENAIILHQEISNLIDGIDVVSGDYYAPTRKYSKIPGVKNIRLSWNNTIIVKLLSPKGHLLPDRINVRGQEYEIEFSYSRHYDECLDY